MANDMFFSYSYPPYRFPEYLAVPFGSWELFCS